MGCRSFSFKLLCCMSLSCNFSIKLDLMLKKGVPVETLGLLQHDARYLPFQLSQ